MNFNERLEKACNGCDKIPPYGQGRQVVIAKMLGVSQEAVRKWFAGESKPRSASMHALANILDVEHVWLALGTESSETQRFREIARTQDAGLYCFTAYLIKNGFSVAYSKEPSETSDIIAIRDGEVSKFKVTCAESSSLTKVDNAKWAKSQVKEGTVLAGCLDISTELGRLDYAFYDLTAIPVGCNAKAPILNLEPK